MKSITYLLVLALFVGCRSGAQRPDSNEDIATNSKSDGPIIGKWLVVDATVLPFEHISFCKKLNLKSVFEFTREGVLNVYESLNGEICTRDQTFEIRDNALEILEWDMLFNYGIEQLTADTLELRIDRIPGYFWTEADYNDPKVKEQLAEVKANGILLTLEKIKSGGF